MNTNLAYSADRIMNAYALQLDKASNKYKALYKAVKYCIENEDLPPNWLMPPTRKLAELLQVSRTTVITAYELLMLEKLIEARPGSGYLITNTDAQEGQHNIQETIDQGAVFPDISKKGQAFLENVGLLNRGEDTGIVFKPGLPPIDVFPINKWKNLLNTYWRYIRASDLSYGQTSGTYRLKVQICNYLKVSRSIKVNPDQVVVVSGSLQSVYLIASALVDAGDSVVIENPTFPNVHSIFKSFRSQLLPVPLDEEGIDIEMLNEKTRNSAPKLIHLTPSNNYPLGIKMSLERRKAILQYASSHGAYIIENDYEHEVGNEANRLPALYNLDQDRRTIYLGTFNRLLYPSIRLGFMIVPNQLVDVVAALQEHSHRFVAPSTQIVMGQFIERNFMYQHLRDMVSIAKKRAHIFFDVFEKENTKSMKLLQLSFYSLHLTAVFTKPVSVKKEKQIINALAAKNISVFALSKCYVGNPVKTGLIIGFSTVRSSRLPEKVKLLIKVVNGELAKS